MFKDYLYPLMTFFKSNIIVIAPSKITQSNQSILVQLLSTYNYL
jgi:hypothetical protein